MKTIIIIRHGKAEHPDYPKNDFDRDLTSRGRKDARIIANEVKQHVKAPIHFISSNANRAIQTAHIFAEALNFPHQQIETEESLYYGVTTTEFLERISHCSPETETILVFGHNPTQAMLADRLLQHFNGFIPTSCAVAINFDVDEWHAISARNGKLQFHNYPKMFR